MFLNLKTPPKACLRIHSSQEPGSHYKSGNGAYVCSIQKRLKNNNKEEKHESIFVNLILCNIYLEEELSCVFCLFGF